MTLASIDPIDIAAHVENVRTHCESVGVGCSPAAVSVGIEDAFHEGEDLRFAVSEIDSAPVPAQTEIRQPPTGVEVHRGEDGKKLLNIQHRIGVLKAPQPLGPVVECIDLHMLGWSETEILNEVCELVDRHVRPYVAIVQQGE